MLINANKIWVSSGGHCCYTKGPAKIIINCNIFNTVGKVIMYSDHND